MKCHYTKGKGEKYLIPYCMAVAHSNDIEDCTCKEDGEKTIIERIAVLETQIQELQKKMHDLVLKVPPRYEI